MNPFDIIKQRKSSRNYITKSIEPDRKNKLLEYMKQIDTGLFNEKIDFQLIEKINTDQKPMKLDYGLIKNHSSYILAKTKKSKSSRVSFGYLAEKIVLKATELELGTCWVGYFDESYFPEIKIEADEEIPGIITVGYPRQSRSFGEKILRFTAKSAKRKEWTELFFSGNIKSPLTKEIAGRYSDSLEMSRLAPSSGNTQPWRIIKENKSNTFHFFKKPVSQRYELKGLHDIDLGICLAHFEVASIYSGLKGTWKHADPGKSIIPENPGLEYILSWFEQDK